MSNGLLLEDMGEMSEYLLVFSSMLCALMWEVGP